MSSTTALPKRRASAGRFVRTVFLAVLAALLPIGIGPVSPALAALKPSVFAPPARSVLATPLLATPTLSVAWSAPSAVATFGTGIVFRQPLQAGGLMARAEILLDYPDATGPLVVPLNGDQPGAVPSQLTFELREADGHIVPNTTIRAHWRLLTADGRTSVGPVVSVTYADTRFAWQTVAGPIVRVHWYRGSAAFGARTLAIGERAVAQASALLGVTEDRPIDFFVYAEQQAFYDALGPGTRENVGGEAHADIRTMFALITPDEIDASWVGVVVPHELTHLVFDTAVRNAYHFPPRWLNEGLAVYLSEGYTSAWRAAVTGAVQQATIIPLDGLAGQFPTTRDQFYLAYGESVSAIDYLVRTYGRVALVRLIHLYAGGVSDDQAFRTGLATGAGAPGPDVATFQAAWLRDLGASTPTVYGPRPAPPGPLPAAWVGTGETAPGASTSAPAAGTPRAATGGAPGGATSAPIGSGAALVVPIGVALGVLLLGLLAILARGRLHRRRSRAGSKDPAP